MIPRDYQQEAHDRAFGYLKRCQGNPVIGAPTGSGKSIIIAMVCKSLASIGYRAIVLQRQKELIQQNVDKVLRMADLDVGIYSAGLNRRQCDHDFVFATVQSVYQKAELFGQRNLVIVDECHQIPSNETSQYGQFLESLKEITPGVRMLGLTATPYRLDCGPIIGDGQPFDGMAYTIPIKTLLDGGYICPLISKPVTQVDLTGVGKTNWDYNESEMAQAFMDINAEAVGEMVTIAEQENRKHCLVFGSSVDHCYEIRDELIRHGQPEGSVALVLGDTPPLVRSTVIADYVAGRTKWLVNCQVLTTGFDAPITDMLCLLRSTMSPGLMAQMVGRGMRIAEGKEDCLILDYGGNIATHGAIDSPDFGVKSRKGTSAAGLGPTKECPSCQQFVPAGAGECPCGFRFPKPERKIGSASEKSKPIMESTVEAIELRVADVFYSLHQKPGKIPSLRVDYIPEPEDRTDGVPAMFSAWWCLEHAGFARMKAEREWRKASNNYPPMTIEEALMLADSDALGKPDRIWVRPEGKYWRVETPKKIEKPAFVSLDYDEEVPF